MTRREFTLAAAVGCAVTGCSARPETREPSQAAEPGGPWRGPEFQRGVNFTAEWPDRYGSASAAARLRSLPGYGVDSVALVPYGFNRKGSTEIRAGGRHSWERSPAIKHLTAVAHDAGMRVMLKPQLWVPRAFPGEVSFDTRKETEEWFRGYEAFVARYAKLARESGADLFCVGVEFSRMIRHEEHWRKIIALARDSYGGRLLYAANWGEEFERVAFWDALDFIGLNNYYPLPDDLNTDAIVTAVGAVAKKFDRPVIFPEIGFASLKATHKAPWSEDPREISLEDQARCYEAVFRGFYYQPWFEGMYWWKVGSNGRGGPRDGSHSPWDKPAMEVMARWYKKGRTS